MQEPDKMQPAAPGAPPPAGMTMPPTGTSPAGEMAMAGNRAVTPLQIAAMTLLTLLALGAGVLIAALGGNFGMSVRDMRAGAGGLVMPPGMVMSNNMSTAAAQGMAAVDPAAVRYTAPADTRGDQPLVPTRVGDTLVFTLTTSIIKWNILPGTQVMAYTYNQQVPGPRIRVKVGDKLRINVQNMLPEATTVHWHGLILPNNMDGPADVTQAPIAPGTTFAYEFTPQQAGTYFYHSHREPDRQQALGLYGALIIDPATPPAAPAYSREVVVQLQEWTVRNGSTFPAMPMEGLLPNFFTINGKAYPATETVNIKQGETVLVRFIGTSSAFSHPMHIHGGPFRIIETDGNPVPPAAQLLKDTVNVSPGERYDVLWTAREPGRWLLHCHILHHTTNDGTEEQGGGGLTMILNVVP